MKSIFYVMTIAGALLQALLTASGATWEGDAPDPRQPDILLIVSEDNGPHLSCYGDRNVQTPVLDRLAGEGVRFTNAYVTQAGCSPSRSSILTGLYPHRNGQIGLATHRYTMYRHWPNLPLLLKKAGYHTGIIGKLHVNPEAAFPFDFNCNNKAVKGRDVDSIASLAGEFMDASGEPFFLMVNYPDAHVPYRDQVKGIPRDPLKPGDVTLFPQVGAQTPQARESVAGYYNGIKRLDAGIGLLLEQLRRSGRYDNTLIIYIADHGPQLSRGKMTSYEFGTKIPLIIRWPDQAVQGQTAHGQAAQSQVRDELVSTLDLMPTLLETAGARAPASLPGRSLLSLLKGEQSGEQWREYLFTEYNVHFPHTFFPQRTVRNGRYKLIINCLQAFQGLRRPSPLLERYIGYGRDVSREGIKAAPEEVQQAYTTFEHPPVIELYDLLEDPYEYHNLAGDPDYAAIKAKLKTQLEKWQRRTADPLADPEKLRLLAEEHDNLTRNNTAAVWVARDSDYVWRYPEYLTK